MDIQSNVANCIKHYRKEMGMSQEQLAERLGVTSQAVSKWECMQSIPDIYALAELTELFGITSDKLLFNREPESTASATETDGKNEDANNNEFSEPIEEQSFNEAHYGKKYGRKCYFDALPNDDVLRVLQFCGRRLLSEDRYDENVFIPLAIDRDLGDKIEKLDVWGNLRLNGSIGGDVDCGNVDILYCAGNVDCGNVEQIVSCAGDIDCGNVGRIESCAGDIDCGNVGVIENCAGDIK